MAPPSASWIRLIALSIAMYTLLVILVPIVCLYKHQKLDEMRQATLMGHIRRIDHVLANTGPGGSGDAL